MNKIFSLTLLAAMSMTASSQTLFTATSVEGVEITFKVLDENAKTCCVGNDDFKLIDSSKEPSATNLSCISIDPATTGKVTIPQTANGYTVTRIGEGAFAFCDINAVEIPATVSSIGHEAFWTCKNITSMPLSDNITELGQGVFMGCEALTDIHLPTGLTEIPGGLLQSCHSLQSLDLPVGITVIGDGALAYCTSLTHLTIPEGVTTLSQSAIMHCEALQTVSLPTTLTRIENGVFTSCHALTACELPQGITYLGDYVYWDCVSLTSFTLPASLTHIGTFLFASDPLLTSIYSYLPEPIDLGDWLGDWHNSATFTMLPGATTGECTLYVPAGTVDLYRAADGWNVFVNIEEMPESSIEHVDMTANDANAPYYDLMGRIVKHPTTGGIYIRGGKKVFLR